MLLAGPGAGKSWALTQLADDLADAGQIVARHYCFLDPGDELLERRVIADTFFGNLLGELNDALAGRSDLPPFGFAAGPAELERRLAEAAAVGVRIVLIIDGLDHIARVRAASVTLSEADTDIVEYLATLQLPITVTLVIGTQPGDHLAPLCDAFGDTLATHEVEPWSADDIVGLARSHGLLATFDQLHWRDAEDRKTVLDLLTARSEGNPLYARYLIRGLMKALTEGLAATPEEWLRDTPVIEGDIARYYQHLYARVSQEAKAVADLLGVLDFGVTDRDLVEITGPLLGGWVGDALTALAPILSQATAQGGVRIFHESFRRFMLTRLQSAGRQLSSVLNPVITWLVSRDFYGDAKSYRFLLLLLRRAGRESEVLERVTESFVRESLLGGHSEQAIEQNLWLACDVAARAQDWVALARCSELLRSLATCFDEGANRWDDYWRAFQAIHGAEATAERLLFDGRPTLERDEGLLVCAAVDAAHAVAPWKEYLNLPVDDDQDRHTVPASDPGDALLTDEPIWLAVLQGRLRLGQWFRVVHKVHSHLCLGESTLSPTFVRRVGRLLAEELSPHLVERIAQRADPARSTVFSLPAPYACALLLGAADSLHGGHDGRARAMAAAALAFATSPEEVMRCVERGASVAAAQSLTMDPVTLMKRFEHAGMLDAVTVRRWVASARLAAHGPDAARHLADQRREIAGYGWYPCWIRFVLAIAEAEAAQRAGHPALPAEAFNELTRDMRPFAGDPRACDLFSIHKVINESLSLGFSLLRTSEEWCEVLPVVLDVRRQTATRLDREDGGPISTGDLVVILAKFADRDEARKHVDDALDTLISETEALGTYYSGHAELHLQAATVRATAALPRALDHWQRAAPFLLGYGFHKDPALFDAIESVSALSAHDRPQALAGLVALQSSISAVLRHTDGRTTKGTPNAWFRALLAVDPVLAIDNLIRSYASDPGAPGWWVGIALTDAIGDLNGKADPLLLDALWESVLFDVEYENQSGELVTQRLTPLKALLVASPDYARERFIRLCAEVADDSRRYRKSGLETLRDFASKHGLPWIVPPAPPTPPTAAGERKVRANNTVIRTSSRGPVFAPDARITDLVAGIRSALNVIELDRETVEALVLPLAYRLPEMLTQGEVTQVHRLLYLLARETPKWSRQSNDPLPLLAECLEHSGDVDLATLAYTLAYTSAHGGGGWLAMGGLDSSPLLDRAMQLNPAIAKSVLAKEVAEKLRRGQYYGISRHLVEQLARWGDPGVATATWWQAFCILNARLPLPGEVQYFESLVPSKRPVWSTDEALAALLVTRISDPILNRKKAALGAFRRLVAIHPTVFVAALTRALERDTCVSSLQLILQALDEMPTFPWELVHALDAPLRSHGSSSSWSVASLATRLLIRAGRPASVRYRGVAEPTAAIRPAGRALLSMGTHGEALSALTSLWPELPQHLLGRLSDPAFECEETKTIVNERWELERGRSRDAVPRAEVLGWPTELYISALDELLAHFIHEPSQYTGPRSVEEDALRWVLPQASLHVSWNASRVPRPAGEPAQSVREGVGDLPRIADGDPLYPGWVRIAWQETSFYRQDDRTYLAADHVTQAFAAAVCVLDDGDVPDTATPLPPGAADEWWEEVDCACAIGDVAGPQPVYVDLLDDWLGRRFVLIPPLVLRLTLNLKAPTPGQALQWKDPTGRAAVVMRTWRLRSNGYGIEAHSLVGSDVLVRPDVMAHLDLLKATPLRQLCRKQTAQLPNR
ncbi:hypothetical protein ASG87_05600 [Frateuria sp. Soil773]|nr:hypothetical protein ASG87_05600 [Frateuria sp. Soil773]